MMGEISPGYLSDQFNKRKKELQDDGSDPTMMEDELRKTFETSVDGKRPFIQFFIFFFLVGVLI